MKPRTGIDLAVWICYKLNSMKYLPLFLMCFILCVPAGRSSQLLDRVIAVVDNEAITQSELDMLLRPVYEQYKEQFKGERLFKELTEARRKILNQLIEDRLVFQEAEQRGITVSNEQLDEQMKEFQQRFPDEATMHETLRVQGMTLADIRDRFRRQTMIRALHDSEIRSKVVVSPTEVQAYYQAHPEEFSRKDRVRVRSLTIKKSDYARDKGLKDEEAWNLMQELVEDIRSGEDFGRLASEYSQDIHAAEDGLGDWVERGTMIRAIDDVIFSMRPGETSEVIETAMGYHLFRLEAREDGQTLSFEEVRDEIYGRLYRDKSNERFEEWMSELKEQAYISVR